MHPSPITAGFYLSFVETALFLLSQLYNGNLKFEEMKRINQIKTRIAELSVKILHEFWF